MTRRRDPGWSDPTVLAAEAVAEASQARELAAHLRALADDSHPIMADLIREHAAFEELQAARWDQVAADPETAIAAAPRLGPIARIRIARLRLQRLRLGRRLARVGQ